MQNLADDLLPPISAVSAEAPRNTAIANKALFRIGASVPRRWVPAARRGFSGVAPHLPAGLRHRLNRLIGMMRPDMGAIERAYPAWVSQYDHIDQKARREITAQISAMREPFRLSVLMPVFNPAPKHLLAAIHSVQDQLYPWWELCIADDASSDPAVAETLREVAAGDHRIKIKWRRRNGHICAASNDALRLATGRFVALLDHDDILPPHALYEVARLIEARPDADLIYSDEDHIDDEGHRSHPYFKPAWNPELMLGQNLVSHLGVYRRTLMEQVGGFREGFEGSQDYDLALRVMAATTADHILHIPKILYHWRQGSTKRSFSEASHESCVASGRRAVADIVRHDFPTAMTEPAPCPAGWTRVIFPVPNPMPLVTIVVEGPLPAHFDTEKLLSKTEYPAVEVIVSAAFPSSQSSAHIAEFGANAAARQARGEVLVFLDPTLEPIEPGWLHEMLSHAVRRDVGAVGAKLIAADDTILHAGISLGSPALAFLPLKGRPKAQIGYFGALRLTRDVAAISGGCVMVSRDAFQAVGGYDDVRLPRLLADVDLCLKLADCGLRNLWTPYAELRQREQPSNPFAMSALASESAVIRMRQRWGQRLLADPFWNPNLDSGPDGFALAFPPHLNPARATECPIGENQKHLATAAGC